MMRFTYGTMAAGKSTLALQLHWSLKTSGRPVALWTFGDRTGQQQITSRIGISADADTITPGENLEEKLASLVDLKIKDLIVDEAQFASAAQIDQIADLVDYHAVEVHLFGLAADFTLTLFEGAARLFAVADVVNSLPVEARCWCGAPGRCNARIDHNGNVLREGPQKIIGDIGETGETTYEVLCRKHFHTGESHIKNTTTLTLDL